MFITLLVLECFECAHLVENLSTLHIPYAHSAISTAYSHSPTAIVLAPRTTQQCVLEAGGRAHENTVYARW